jgi:tripartite-type tricarboxylate transporter receptor subunit TctC
MLHGRPFRVNATKLLRRRFLHLAAGAGALPAVLRIAQAQTYPTKPVRIVVGFAAGGGTDFIARLMGQWLSERLGQPFVIENRPGAGGTIGAETVVNARPDGYRLLMVSSPNAVNTTLYDNLKFIFHRDIAPVAGIIRVPNVIDVNPSVPVRTLPEFISYAKANPGKLNMGSGGMGTSQHLAGELFKMMAGVNMVHVPYRSGTAAITDLLGGQVQVMFDVVMESIEYIRAGRLRPLAVTTATRFEGLPDIPTVSEFVPGYEADSWWGVGAPRDTPAEIIDKLNREINAALADPKMKARLRDLGATVIPGSPSAFGKLIAEETERWGKVIRAANIKPE